MRLIEYHKMSQDRHHEGFPGVSDGKESAYKAGDPGSIPGVGISPGKWNDNPLQYSCPLPWTGEPGGLQFTGSHRVRHKCSRKKRIGTMGFIEGEEREKGQHNYFKKLWLKLSKLREGNRYPDFKGPENFK